MIILKCLIEFQRDGLAQFYELKRTEGYLDRSATGHGSDLVSIYFPSTLC